MLTVIHATVSTLVKLEEQNEELRRENDGMKGVKHVEAPASTRVTGEPQHNHSMQGAVIQVAWSVSIVVAALASVHYSLIVACAAALQCHVH